MPATETNGTALAGTSRVTSLDALRGFVMFLMIFVNDLAGAGRVVPDWMVHFSDRHRGGSGMTFVDLVFPGFLFIVGMSVPLALGARIARGEPVWRVFGHCLLRAISLMAIGILMVHETPDSTRLGWSGHWWCTWMYLSAIAAFCVIAPRGGDAPGCQSGRRWVWISRGLRATGIVGMVLLALSFRGASGERILTLEPLSLRTEWYGILGLIGWAYLAACVVFLVFGTQRTAQLGCMALLMCLFAAERNGAFDGFWLQRVVGIGGTLGSLGGIAVGGLLLGSMAVSQEHRGLEAKTRFTVWFVLGCSAGALLLHRLYGISKNQATPSWCLWSCAITGLLWYVFHALGGLRRTECVASPLARAGQNVLLAYLLSEMQPGLLAALGWADGYGRLAATLPAAVTRSAVCGVVILLLSTCLNRIGFRLKL